MTYGAPIPRCPDGGAYSTGCRCDFCRSQVAKRMKEYRLRKLQNAKGQRLPNDFLDAEPYRKIVCEARGRGISQREICRLTGVHRSTISSLTRGMKKIRRDTAYRIARGLQNPDKRSVTGNTLVPNAKAKQVILSLCAQGWSKPHQREIIQKNLGVSGGFLQSITTRKWQSTTRENERTVMWLAEAIGSKRGPSQRVATLMKAKGIFPLCHYNVKGELIESTLSAEQRTILERVRFRHG